MKRIVIFQEGSNIVELFDDDGRDVPEYAEGLSALLKVSNVSIINTTSGSFVTRPSKVTGIYVQEDIPSPTNPKKDPLKKNPPKKKPIPEGVDIITDVD